MWGVVVGGVGRNAASVVCRSSGEGGFLPGGGRGKEGEGVGEGSASAVQLGCSLAQDAAQRDGDGDTPNRETQQ